MTKKRLQTELILASIVTILMTACSNNRNKLTSTTYETKTEAKEACNKWTRSDGRVILFPDVEEEKEIEGSRWTTLDELIESGDIKNEGQSHSTARIGFNTRSNRYTLGTVVNGYCKEEDDQYLGYRRTGGITETYDVDDEKIPRTYMELLEKRVRTGRVTDKEGNTTAWILPSGDKLYKRFRYK